MAKKEKEGTDSKESKNLDSKSLLSGILNNSKDDHYNYQERVDWAISSGSLLLDSAIGKIGPSLIRMCGSNNEGKTPATLEIVRNFLNDVPNSKALWVIAEGRGLSDENKERCGLKFVYDPSEWEVGTVFVLESNVYELFIQTVKTLVKSNPENIKYCFVVDSIDGLNLRDDLEKEVESNAKVAGSPSLSKKMLQQLSLGMFKFGHLMILISQVTSEIKLNQYEKTANRGGNFSGGNALLHAADFIFEFEPSFGGDFILDNPNGKLNDGKTKVIGKNAKIIIAKSIVESSRKMKVTYPVKYGRSPSGIWREREVTDCLIAWGFIKKGGAWFTFTDETLEELANNGFTDIDKQYQGMNNVYNLFEQNPSLCDYFYNKFRKLISQ